MKQEEEIELENSIKCIIQGRISAEKRKHPDLDWIELASIKLASEVMGWGRVKTIEIQALKDEINDRGIRIKYLVEVGDDLLKKQRTDRQQAQQEQLKSIINIINCLAFDSIVGVVVDKKKLIENLEVKK